jgi:hypothetical protein
MVLGLLGGVFEPAIPDWAYQDGNEYFVRGAASSYNNQTNAVDHIVKYGDRLFLMGIYMKTSSSPYHVIINAMEYFRDTNTFGAHKQLQINVRGEHAKAIGSDRGIYLLALDRNSTNTYKYDYDTNTAAVVSNYPYRDSYGDPDAYGLTEFFDEVDGDSIYAHQNQRLFRFSTSTHAWTELPKNTAFTRPDYNLKFAGICRLTSINSIVIVGGYWYNDAHELYNFDLSTQTWTHRASGQCQGATHVSAYPNGDTLVGLGHTQIFNDYPLKSCYSYTASTNTFTELLRLPTGADYGGTSPQVTIKDTVYRVFENQVLLYINKAFY